MSFVLLATSLTSWAPMFSKASSSSISLAIVTPSLVMVGEPNFLSSTTLRPLGPMVIRTASATLSTPRLSAERASASYASCFAISIPGPTPSPRRVGRAMAWGVAIGVGAVVLRELVRPREQPARLIDWGRVEEIALARCGEPQDLAADLSRDTAYQQIAAEL